ncbi:hypothetical protein [Natronolimnohabitans innermongolicus]|uniref:Uncharacterized protein n=1 Tax=Natronolimnohabitans innermongolicus JCM 12255 TaxID=1227499 RepID=L9X0U4_9EURY|nr:hypothetical protein [Natronolimnohabitans innermongolicus]ELY55051.1 hypothetical protein C493_11907 [Natronolimnohabitans innermongolicus JCM 12255]
MGLRLWVAEETPEHQSRTDHDTWREYFLNPTDVAGLFTRATLLSVLAATLSIVAAIVEIAVVQPTANAISVWALLCSLAAASLSMFGYALWSVGQQRRLKRHRAADDEPPLLERPVRALQIAFTDGDELDEYEARVQRTVLGLLLSLLLGALPLRIFGGALVHSLPVA